MIYLIDTIGKETGMHIYDQAFKKALEEQDLQIEILSNYKSDGEGIVKLFQNFYRGGKCRKMLQFTWALIRMLCFRLMHASDEDIYVYQSFGLRKIDQLFIRALLGHPRLFVVVHDILEITDHKNEKANKDAKMDFYNNHIPAVICHSRDSERLLKTYGYRGKTLYFPHFSYGFSKDIDITEVSSEIKSAFCKGKTNFLFFGQLRETKGILILQQAIDIIAQKHPEFAQNAHIILAGVDKSRIIADRKEPPFVSSILRHINDSELNYLFLQKPTVLLPYTEIYQSGVLEVVIYFQCPSLMSDIPFFSQMAERYPTFVTLYGPNTPENLAKAMLSASINPQKNYFSIEDTEKYKADHDCKDLCAYLTTKI